MWNRLLIFTLVFIFSCGEDIKISSVNKHKGANVLDVYPYGSLKTSVLILKKNNIIYKIRCYNNEIGNLKIKDTIK